MKALICCDYSAAGKYILLEAQKFLTVFAGAEIHVYSVIDMSVVSVAGMYRNSEIMSLLNEEAEEINKYAQNIFADKEIHFSSEVGYPAETILQKVKNISPDLLILGTHGKTGLGRVLIGSVAENVLRHALCNTLIVPVKHL